jgi:SAM-dependent methyltransferase
LDACKTTKEQRAHFMLSEEFKRGNRQFSIPMSPSEAQGRQMTREHIIWAYRLFLDREPENEAVISGKLDAWRTTPELRAHFMSSQEFQQKNPRFSITVTASDGLPVPPGDLISLVGDNPDVSWFLKGGFLATQSIVGVLEKNGLNVKDFESILDFGCGCGRVIRHWKSIYAGKLFGTDYNPALINWSKQNLDFAQFAVNDLSPPLSYDDQTFDFIYALSVFTHLPEALQFSWMDEMARVLRPGGLLLITTHGEHYLPQLMPDERDRFRRGQLVVRSEELAGTNVCSAFHPEEFVCNKLANASDFTVIDFVPEGAKGNPYQDVFLLQRQRETQEAPRHA